MAHAPTDVGESASHGGDVCADADGGDVLPLLQGFRVERDGDGSRIAIYRREDAGHLSPALHPDASTEDGVSLAGQHAPELHPRSGNDGERGTRGDCLLLLSKQYPAREPVL